MVAISTLSQHSVHPTDTNITTLVKYAGVLYNQADEHSSQPCTGIEQMSVVLLPVFEYVALGKKKKLVLSSYPCIMRVFFHRNVRVRGLHCIITSTVLPYIEGVTWIVRLCARPGSGRLEKLF